MLPTTVSSIILFLGCIATAFPSPLVHRETKPWPYNYFALGDSYASGHGAGQYWQPYKPVADTKKCKRFDGSYPVQLRQSLPITQDLGQENDHFRFVACSGDELKDIDGQISKLYGEKAELVTLSISGNDFEFGEVVKKCVYNGFSFKENPFSPWAHTQCAKARSAARSKIYSNDIWNTYRDKVVRQIMEDVVNPKRGILVITGYPRFFAPIIAGNDPCLNKQFPIPNFVANGNILDPVVRNELNLFVDIVNVRIKEDVVSILNPSYGNRIKFVDINPGYDTHRFCEPNKPDPVGANDPDTYFISLGTSLQETSFTSNMRRNFTSAPYHNDTSPQDGDDLVPGTGPDEFHRTSSFHPKSQGHLETAESIQRIALGWGFAHEFGSRPTLDCYPTEVVPPNPIVAAKGFQAVEPNAILGAIRAVLCANKCEVPTIHENFGIDPSTVNIREGPNGLCEISVGVEGDSEAYGLRDQSISGDQIDQCWQITWDIITQCVNNGANEGWQYDWGRPGFYQTGYRQMNPSTGWHQHSPITKVLERKVILAPTGRAVSSECDGHGWATTSNCQSDGCAGRNGLCTAGDFTGCKCKGNSQDDPGTPSVPLLWFCQDTCCPTGAFSSAWWQSQWCQANCEGVRQQFC